MCGAATRICRWSSARSCRQLSAEPWISAATCTGSGDLRAAALERARAGARDFVLRMAAAAAGISEPARRGHGGFELAARGTGAAAGARRSRFRGARRGHAACAMAATATVRSDQRRVERPACRRPLDPDRPARAAMRAGRRDPDSQFDVSWRNDDAACWICARAPAICAPIPCCRSPDCCRTRTFASGCGRSRRAASGWTRRSCCAREPPTEPWRLQIQAKFRDAGFAPVGARPGLRGLTGTLAGTESGGHVEHRYAHGGVRLAGAISAAGESRRSECDAVLEAHERGTAGRDAAIGG